MRTWIILLFVIALNLKETDLTAQEVIKHPKRIFQSEDGRIYTNKNLPIYLRMATSPDEKAESVLLKSESMPQYTNPMYFDTEGLNTLRSPSAVDTATRKMVYPEQDIIFEVYADGHPPKTKIDYGKVLTVKKQDTVYLGGLTTLSIASNDQLSGIQVIYYSLDGQPFKTYTDPIEFEKEGVYSLKCYGIDNVGNSEDVIYKKIVIDASNPATQLEIEGDRHENVLSERSSIQLIASDEYGIDAIYYSIDNAPEKVYKYKIKGSYLRQGEHTITYYSIDNLGNKEVAKQFDFYIDKTPPTVVEEIIGRTFVANGKEYSSGRSKLKLTTFDNKAGVKEVFYSINGNEYEKYEKPFYLSNSSGNLVFKTYAVDYVNNKSTIEEQSSSSSIPYIDLSGPKLSHRFIGPTFVLDDTVYVSNKTKISLRANDAESGMDRIEYRVNNEENIPYNEPFTLPKEGVYNIVFNGYDNVSNSNFGEVLVKVDTTGPEIFSRFSIPPKGISVFDSTKMDAYPPHLVIFLSSTDLEVGFDKMYYSLNNGKETPYQGLINNFNNSSKYNLKIKAADKLGNINESELNFGIKR